jgi:hypothetical protein
LTQKSNATAPLSVPGTSSITDAIGSRAYSVPVAPQHAVRRLFHGMKPPEPVMSVHHSVPPVIADFTCKRSGEPSRLVTSMITPAFVGATVVDVMPGPSLKLKPRIAVPLKSACAETVPATQRGMPVVCVSKLIGVMLEPAPLVEVHT